MERDDDDRPDRPGPGGPEMRQQIERRIEQLQRRLDELSGERAGRPAPRAGIENQPRPFAGRGEAGPGAPRFARGKHRGQHANAFPSYSQLLRFWMRHHGGRQVFARGVFGAGPGPQAFGGPDGGRPDFGPGMGRMRRMGGMPGMGPMGPRGPMGAMRGMNPQGFQQQRPGLWLDQRGPGRFGPGGPGRAPGGRGPGQLDQDARPRFGPGPGPRDFNRSGPDQDDDDRPAPPPRPFRGRVD